MKNLDLKNYKVLMGLFTLLFLTSIVQAGTMLKVKQLDQTAQVKDALTVKGGNINTKDNLIDTIQPPRGGEGDCLEYGYVSNETHAYSNIIQSSPAYLNINSHFTLKNICTHDVYVVNPRDLVAQNTPGVFNAVYTAVQYQNAGGFSDIYTLEDGEPSNTFSYGSENLSCPNCTTPDVSTTSNIVSSSPQQMGAFLLEPNQRRNFTLTYFLSPNFINSGVQEAVTLDNFRLATKKFKWFKTSSLNDNLITAGEIWTQNLSPDQIENSAHDFIKMSFPQ